MISSALSSTIINWNKVKASSACQRCQRDHNVDIVYTQLPLSPEGGLSIDQVMGPLVTE